ncbi:MAG: hypothetical protein IPL03_09700 [Sterolibacteriaceae bacterium]|nr:hypothetical protein [Candidatus Methylophosphatis haderslevensis]
MTSYLDSVSLKRPAILHTDRRIAVALAISLCLHAGLLLLRGAAPVERPRSLGDERSERLDVTLAPPAAPRAPPVASAAPAPPPTAPRRKPLRSTASRPDRLTAPPAPNRPAIEQPTQAEVQARREATARFLEEIRPLPQPPATDLSQQALAMARNLARGSADEAADNRREAPFRTPRAARNEDGGNPLSMELYFEAFVQKLNRSATFVSKDRREHGADVAVVQVQLNADGTLRRYRILSAADQQSEIDYVRRVVERAAPFAAFPPDIRRNNDSLSFQICILPARAGAGGGGFSRTFGGRDCRDLG